MNSTDEHDLCLTRLKKLENIRQDFIANVSHELRTPLTVFLGYLETLIDEAKDHPWQPILLQMQQQSHRMEKLVEDLLLLARLESEQHMNDDKQRVSAAALIRAICKDAQAINRSHNITAHVDEQLTIMGHEHELHSAFSNLVVNAVYYTPDHGHITVSWYQQDNEAVFSVQDTGIGIAEKHLSRLTERFYRADKARSRANGGTGLGLAIIKHVLLRHQAKLKISSELGVGSTFECRFSC